MDSHRDEIVKEYHLEDCPEYLILDIVRLVTSDPNDSLRDCYWCEVCGSINSAADVLSPTRQQELRDMFLDGGRY